MWLQGEYAILNAGEAALKAALQATNDFTLEVVELQQSHSGEKSSLVN